MLPVDQDSPALTHHNTHYIQPLAGIWDLRSYFRLPDPDERLPGEGPEARVGAVDDASVGGGPHPALGVVEDAGAGVAVPVGVETLVMAVSHSVVVEPPGDRAQ